MVRLIDANEPLRKIQKEIEKVQVWRDKKANRKDAVLFIDEIYKLDNWLGVYAECADFIAEVHTVDAVEVVHGRWISKGYKIECSVCGHRAFLGTHDPVLHTEEKNIRKYCHNCGAKMDGERKDE